ncbi:hypothetical protein N656DRAFT_193591 [Canariomyces notabilis]|uniref:Uncharacterized protein n=1 Tax=Canariomyces notabilis TaxID=2074819 RepID=A0AAN6T9Z0_9PEZI|nr:hypothetical protein N656DRAFT_193591 [Canariomyces arenarius]
MNETSCAGFPVHQLQTFSSSSLHDLHSSKILPSFLSRTRFRRTHLNPAPCSCSCWVLATVWAVANQTHKRDHVCKTWQAPEMRLGKDWVEVEVAGMARVARPRGLG